MARARHHLELGVRERLGQEAAEREVRVVPLAAEHERGHDDEGRLDARVRGLTHEATEPTRLQAGDLTRSEGAMRLRELGDELAVQELSRHEPRDSPERAHPEPKATREPLEGGADDEPPNGIRPRGGGLERREPAEREPAEIDRRCPRDELLDLLHRRVPAARICGHEVRGDDLAVPTESVDLRLPGAGPGADSVEEDERRQVDVSSAAASSRTAVWVSTSSSVVAGDMSAMLWNGVRRIPRFNA